MKNLLCLTIILLNYKLLYLVPWSHVEGKFNTMDVTISFIGIWMVYLLVFNIEVFYNKYASFIVMLMILVAFHIPYAMIKYDVAFIDAIIASRVFLLYFSYFVFLDLFRDEAAMRRFLNGLTLIAGLAILVGIIDYLGIEILHHRWASEEGQRMRGGIVRAFFPAYWLIVFVSLYSLSQFIHSDNYPRYCIPFWVLSIAAIVFRQTRMIIGCYGLVTGWDLMKRVKNRRSWVLLGIGMIGLVIISLNLDRMLIVDKMIEKTESEITESTGSWGGRVDQLRTTWELVSKNYLIGSATSALRTNAEAYKTFGHQRAVQLVNYSMNSDLGYAVWVKNFGILGLVYLLCLIFTAYRDFHYIRQRDMAPGLIDFAGNYLNYLFISFFTLNHLGKSEGIILFTLTLAILQALRWTIDAKKVTPLSFTSEIS